jgi:starch phosphorylase
MAMAKSLYAGCDIWLNNPLRPLEACGTSGMKSALNGGLNLSIRDGWWDEFADGRNGWAIPSASADSTELRDDLEASALYGLLEGQVRQRFYEGGQHGTSQSWIEMVRHTLTTLGPQLQATRMVENYVTSYYAPSAAAVAEIRAEGFAGARELAAWSTKVIAAWPSVRVSHVESSSGGEAPALGTNVDIRAAVDLGTLSVDEVDVQALYGRVDELDEIEAEGVAHLELSHEGEGSENVYAGSIPLGSPGAFGYAVRVLPRHRLLASHAELGLVSQPDPAELAAVADEVLFR